MYTIQYTVIQYNIVQYWIFAPHAQSVPKAKLGHMEPRAPSVPKSKLGHLNCVRHLVILPLVMAILGFLTIPWLGPKYTEPRATSVPKAKLGHTEPRAPSVQKEKQGHSNCVRHRVILPLVMAILGFLTIPWLGPKDIIHRFLFYMFPDWSSTGSHAFSNLLHFWFRPWTVPHFKPIFGS